MKIECPSCNGTGRYGLHYGPNSGCRRCFGTGKLEVPLTREHILATQLTHIYIYGHDLKRLGKEGWAEVCSGCPNAFPITTKFLPCKDSAAYFTDHLYNECNAIIRRDWNVIAEDQEKTNRSVIVLPKIGDDESEMKTRASIIYEYLRIKLHQLEV